MKFEYTSKTLPAGNAKVFVEGIVCASFTADDAGKAAFEAFKAGVLTMPGATLFNLDSRRFDVGNVAQLASE
jgi:hypothetical protein